MMRWSQFLSFTFTKGFKKPHEMQYQLLLNDVILPHLKVISHSLHFTTYNLLRKFKRPQYHSAYLMRQKKGFTTVFFQQPYDIIVCDRFGNVIQTFNNQSIGYISHYFDHAYFIYFMVVGSIKHFNIHQSDRLTLRRIVSTWKIFEDVVGIK